MLGGLELRELVVSIGAEVLRVCEGAGAGIQRKDKTERVDKEDHVLLPAVLFLFLSFLLSGFIRQGLCAVLESLCGQAGLEITERSSCLCLPSAGFKGVR